MESAANTYNLTFYTKSLEGIRLIKKAIKGDKQAFSEIIKEHKEYLYKTAFLYVKNEEEALEVLHETVYRGFLNINKLQKAKFFKTWITRILINVSLDLLKKKSKLEFLEDNLIISKEIKGVSIEEKLDLYRAIDLLEDNYKTVIIMMYFNDLKIKDIAKIIDIPEGTVKTYLRKAKQTLKHLLKEGELENE